MDGRMDGRTDGHRTVSVWGYALPIGRVKKQENRPNINISHFGEFFICKLTEIKF